ncbi:hypothetical protein B0H10DRAFT_1782845 [Mycena sp. CBHHK59/15]|nr:hypothetical protein B0H10DRAFT_1782845 [Mycena sp. CBHHK59/15]
MTPVRISGTTPGALDPHQPHRLFRRPSSTLSFANFDPRVASADHGWDLRGLSLNEELYRPKRVVIETTCAGESSWRFVPKARRDDGVPDEGQWPRVIDICGQLVECTQDQWDIYKLDPAYDCYVRAAPELTVISVATTRPKEFKHPFGKHRMSSPELCPEMPPSKAVHLDDEADEGADMIIDDQASTEARRSSGPGDRAKKFREEDFSRNTVNYSPTNASKRTRTFSPSAAKRNLEARRLEREKQKRERRERELNLRRQEREQHFLNEIYSEIPNPDGDPIEYEYISDGAESEEDVELDAEAERLASITESRRKLAELEADRPLWEQEAKKRERLEQEEEEARRSKMAERRAAEARKADEERRAKAEREQQQARAKEEARVRDWEERARREREKRQRNERWSYGPWTTQRALERYKTLSDIFDLTKFSPNDPLTFDAVPWPILHSPVSFSVEDVDWAAVESFFAAVKSHMRSQDYVSFVEKSHRRFHPDRWRSRGLLKSVADEADRGCLEVGLPLLWASSFRRHTFLLKLLEPGAPLLHSPATMSDTRDLRRIRSAGDMPASSDVRSPEPLVFQPSRYSESLVIERTRTPVPPPIPEHSEVPIAPPTPVLLPIHNASLYSRTMIFFGYGRGASRARKLLVSLWYNLAWGFVQIVMIITMLTIATHSESKTMPGRNEWTACDRPLGAWSCIYVFRVAFSSSLTYWGWRRDRKAHANADDQETQTANNSSARPATANATASNQSPTNSGSPSTGNTPETPVLPHALLYSRLSILSSLITLSWFLTAHILEYTSIHTCRFSSPHIWWLIFGILCIMYLVVLEVIVLGFVVFVVAPIVFLFWNIFLMCLGRHPMQNPGIIKPDIEKLPKSVVDRIPLVMYIPPPPDAAPAASITVPQPVYSYPPKVAPPSVQPKRRFKFLHRRRDNKDSVAGTPSNDVPERISSQKGESQTWEDHWEQSGYPFVVLEGNRAACAVCLMDFEEPKRIAGHEDSTAVPSSVGSPPSLSAIQEVPVEATTADAENQLKLEDAGEGAQPLRLLACGHVFHKTCLDPWLTDVSGRCPVCQRAVELPTKRNKKGRGS